MQHLVGGAGGKAAARRQGRVESAAEVGRGGSGLIRNTGNRCPGGRKDDAGAGGLRLDLGQDREGAGLGRDRQQKVQSLALRHRDKGGRDRQNRGAIDGDDRGGQGAGADPRGGGGAAIDDPQAEWAGSHPDHLRIGQCAIVGEIGVISHVIGMGHAGHRHAHAARIHGLGLAGRIVHHLHVVHGRGRQCRGNLGRAAEGEIVQHHHGFGDCAGIRLGDSAGIRLGGHHRRGEELLFGQGVEWVLVASGKS